MNAIYLSIGTNLGDKETNIERALILLSEKVRITKRSSIYETAPVGYTDQPWFLNIVTEARTHLSPQTLLQFTQSIEHKMKRVKTIINGPRIIDIDILLYNEENINEENLIIPHPRMVTRAFVMIPLHEIAPELIITGKSIRDLIGNLKGEEIHKRI